MMTVQVDSVSHWLKKKKKGDVGLPPPDEHLKDVLLTPQEVEI